MTKEEKIKEVLLAIEKKAEQDYHSDREVIGLNRIPDVARKSFAEFVTEHTDQQTSSLQKALEERDKEIEKLNESLLDYKGEAENFKEKMLGYKDERDLILKKYSAEVVKKENFILVVADLGEKIKAQSSLIESLAVKLEEIKCSCYDSDGNVINEVGLDQTNEALNLYNNYKNKENGN